jgi:putative PIN family toxin of toxin-antitoxin system
MHVVLDANVIVSGIITPRGSPAAILALWQQRVFELDISPPILAELDRVFHYPKIQERYHLPEEQVQTFLGRLASQSFVVSPEVELTVIAEDAPDNRYLECALAAGAQYIVTGDAHLLKLQQYRGVGILNPTSFLAVLKLQG